MYILAIEVKSGKKREALPGLAAFLKTEPHARPLLMGGDGIPIEQALSRPVTDWFTA